MKTCSRCGKEKSSENFSKSKSKKDGLHTVCKPCDRDRRNDPKKIKEVLSEGMKRCAGCKEVKLRSGFYKKNSTKDGLTFNCKSCMNEKNKDYCDRNKHRNGYQANKAYYDKNKKMNECINYDGVKICYRCKETKPRTEFSIMRSVKGGLNTYCKPCDRIEKKKLRDANPERAKDIHRRAVEAMNERRPWRLLITSKMSYVKRHANKYGIPFTVTADYLEQLMEEQKGLCALTEIPMTCRNGKITSTSASLDKITASEGYVPGNVRFLCHSINSMRLNMSDEEFWDFVDRIKWQRPSKLRLVA